MDVRRECEKSYWGECQHQPKKPHCSQSPIADQEPARERREGNTLSGETDLRECLHSGDDQAQRL